MLSNLETEKSKLIQIVLVGQPNLQDVLSSPEFEQLRQRVTVRYHLRPLDPAETAAYINHRLKKAAIGTPMELSPAFTDLIGRASQGLPRRINIISDAVLLFGYGEDKAVVDVPLVRDVLAELQQTGVLPAPMSAVAAASAAGSVSAAAVETAPPAVPVPDAAAAAAAIAAMQAMERDLAEREARIASRERELAEQHRILTQQYRLLKMQQAQTTAAAAPTAAPWPPASAPAAASGAGAATPAIAARPGAAPSARNVAGQFTVAQRTAAPNVWTRLWRSVSGFGKPLFED